MQHALYLRKKWLKTELGLWWQSVKGLGRFLDSMLENSADVY
jgi:hypothetical protein